MEIGAEVVTTLPCEATVHQRRVSDGALITIQTSLLYLSVISPEMSVISPEMTYYKTSQMSVRTCMHPCSVNIFKPPRLDRWADVD